ncbi:hypothetical protein PFLA_a2313 [Pseudoalteromonas flavipulchra NCIMB 2033 = ATCC BAA-314]|nr:hypothetical protein [Pseudoalteromonas flavipulchra NCIMB 2033 = ATCC BAA-314]
MSVKIKIKPTMQAPQKHLFQVELIDIVSSRYELAKLVKLID